MNIENILTSQEKSLKDEETMSNVSIRFSGFGGQGIVLSSIIVAHGAVLHEGKSAVQTQLYGPESRGGSSKSEVIVSDTEINYPLIEKADVLVALSQEALDRYFPDTHKGSLVIIDPVFIKEVPKDNDVKVIEIPSTKLADELGSRLVANIIVLGALVALTSVISEESLVKAIKENTPPASHQANISGMRAGIEYVRKISS